MSEDTQTMEGVESSSDKSPEPQIHEPVGLSSPQSDLFQTPRAILPTEAEMETEHISQQTEGIQCIPATIPGF